MDSDKTSLIEIDLSDVNQSWAQGRLNDTFVINPNWNNNINISGGTLTWPNTAAPTYTFSDLSITQPPAAKITLTGDDADIEINGESVVGMLKDIRDRLNILQVSEEMEQEWDELRILREQYEAKLSECREKSRAWSALKQAG